MISLTNLINLLLPRHLRKLFDALFFGEFAGNAYKAPAEYSPSESPEAARVPARQNSWK